MSDPTFANLLKLYDLTLDRRKTLTGQATSLLSFTSIIQTVFLGAVITLGTNPTAMPTLLTNANHAIIISLLPVGFVTFMITIILAFTVMVERKWVPAPQVLYGSDEAEWKKTLEDLKKDPSAPIIGYELQIQHGIDYNNKINGYKYTLLTVAYLFLTISIALLTITGVYLVTGLS